MSRSAAQTPDKARKRSQRGIETEQKLLSAANEVFWANGFAGSTVAQIISVSGLSVGSFYHQFTDKDELLQRAAEGVLDDFRVTFAQLDLSRDANTCLFALFYRIAREGRKLVARNRGFYRAIAELAQNQFVNYGPLAMIGPTVAVRMNGMIGDYRDQLAEEPSREVVAHAVQLVTMCVLQTELGMGPMFPDELDKFAQAIARAACGVLGYVGPFDLVSTRRYQR